MLKQNSIPKDKKWLEADELNKRNKPRTITKNFHLEIKAKEREGYHYCPFEFLKQWQWIQSIFYTVNSGRDLQIKRIFPDGRADDYIPKREVHAMLERKFGASLHPLINDWAVYYIPSTAGEIYDPSTHDDFVEIDTTVYRNSYRPSEYTCRCATLKARPPLWQDYLDRLMPKENGCTLASGKPLEQQDYFEAYIAQRLQQPSQPPLIAILLRGEHGTGKNFWMDNIMSPLLGKDNLKSVSLADVTGRFNADLYSSLLVHIEEINDTRGKAGDRLKKLITEESTRAEAKYQQAKVMTKYFGIVASSNVPDPVRIEANDRRYFVPVYSKHREQPDETKLFFAKLTEWLEEKDGLQELADYFYNLDISNFNFRYPPHTSDKEEIMEIQTSAEDKTNKAAMQIGSFYKEYSFALDDVMGEWVLSQSNARQALKRAGFTPVKRRWLATDPNATNRWVHKSLNPDNAPWDTIDYTVFDYKSKTNATISAKGNEFIEVVES